jgi:hypothetical protein
VADSSAQQAQRPGGEPPAGGLAPGEGHGVGLDPVAGRHTPDGTIEPVDPALLEAFGLDPEILHLNHGAFGVAPVVVRKAAARWRERAERNPHRFNRVELAGVFGCTALQAVITRGIEPLGGPVATGARSSSWPLPSGGRAKGPAH